jgi:hypothetical protein
MTLDAPLAANETALAARTCLPCPPGIVCSQLAVRDPPHRLRDGSVYPVGSGSGPLARAEFVYAVALLPCLHSGICNVPSPLGSPSTWEDWIAARSAGATETPEFARFRCRDGHDEQSLLCSRCSPGCFSDGFVCNRCHQGYGALVVVIGIAALAALAAYVWHRSRGGAGEQAGGENTISLVLFFVQVASVLKTSEQV